MDPQTTQQAASVLSDPAITAGLVAIGIATMEIMKSLVQFVTKKLGKKEKDTITLHLYPEASRLLSDTDNKTTEIKAIVGRVDADGTPLVYSDRSVGRSVERIGEIMKSLSDSQARLADTMSRLDERFEYHDRSDAVIFSKIVDAQDRLERIGSKNSDVLIELRKDEQAADSKLDQIIDYVRS
jgi:hypothetical protein